MIRRVRRPACPELAWLELDLTVKLLAVARARQELARAALKLAGASPGAYGRAAQLLDVNARTVRRWAAGAGENEDEDA